MFPDEHEDDSIDDYLYEEDYSTSSDETTPYTISPDRSVDTPPYLIRTSSGIGIPPSPHVPGLISDISSGSGFSTPTDCTFVDQSLCQTPIKVPNRIKRTPKISKRKQREGKRCRRLYDTTVQPQAKNCNGGSSNCKVDFRQLYEAAIRVGFAKYANYKSKRPGSKNQSKKRTSVNKSKKCDNMKVYESDQGRYERLCRVPLNCVNCQQVRYVLHNSTKEPKKTLTTMIYTKRGAEQAVLSHLPYRAKTDETLSETLFNETKDNELGFLINTAQVLQCTWLDDNYEVCEAALTELLEKIDQAENTMDMILDDFDIMSMEDGAVVLEKKHEAVQHVMELLLQMVENAM